MTTKPKKMTRKEAEKLMDSLPDFPPGIPLAVPGTTKSKRKGWLKPILDNAAAEVSQWPERKKSAELRGEEGMERARKPKKRPGYDYVDAFLATMVQGTIQQRNRKRKAILRKLVREAVSETLNTRNGVYCPSLETEIAKKLVP